MTFCCDEMARCALDADVALQYIPRFREFGIFITDGGTAIQQIAYCPWCGLKLPKSLRDEWFDAIWDMGLEPESAQIPDEFQSDQWWKERFL